MTSRFKLTLGCALAFAVSACSSSPTTENSEFAMDEIPELEAETDAVPLGELEQPEGNTFAEGQSEDLGGLDGLEPLPSNELASETVTPPEPAFDSALPPSTDDFASTTAMDAAPAEDPFAQSADPAPFQEGVVPVPPAFDSTPTPFMASASDQSSGSAGSGAYEDYTVGSGDTLMKIAFETYGDLYKWRKIYEDNQDRISNPNRLDSGVVLKLEKPAFAPSIDRNGEKYLIKSGDTLGSISGEIYGTPSKWRKLWESNKQLIKDPNRIFAGFYLYYTVSPDERQDFQQPAPLADVNSMEREPAARDHARAGAQPALDAIGSESPMQAPPMGEPSAGG